MPRICITVPEQPPQPYRFPADSEIITIGRAPECDIDIDHDSISSHHCEMQLVEGGYILVDTHSTNGIELNQTKMDIVDLLDGMDLKVGDVLFNYQLSEEEALAFSQQSIQSHQQNKQALPATTKAPTPEPAPYRPVTSIPAPKADTSGRDFLIFVAFVLLAAASFWFGLDKSHRAVTKSDESPYGRPLMKDVFSKK